MRASPAAFPPPAACLLAAALVLAAPPAGRAQTPECAWGTEGVSLDGALYRKLLLASDGGAGLFVVTSPVNWFDEPQTAPSVGTLRLHHILEQGVLDPALPAGGVPFYTPPDPTDYQGTDAARVLPDGAGGLYVLTRACNPVLAHTRCYEHSVLRLLHVSANGTTSPGWPAAGVVIPVMPELESIDQGDIATDGAAGVVVAWMNFDPQAALYPSVRAQRYSASGSALWPGAASGVELLAPTLERHGLRVAGDGTGGVAIVVSGNTAAGQYDLFASRVLADGSLPWGTAGKAVLLQSSYSASVRGVAMDENGLTFVNAVLVPLAGGSPTVTTQLLSLSGARAWGALGVTLGGVSPGPVTASRAVGGYLTMHRDGSGATRFQKQNEFGSPMWGPLPDPGGVVATWTNGAVPFLPPVPMPDGDLVSAWADPGPLYLGPPTVVHAMELDAAGEIAPGWPATGVIVCGADYGHTLSDAIGVVGHVFVAFGNEDDYPATAPRVQRLTRAVLDVAPSLPARSLELSPPVPNPSRGAWGVRFALREAAGVSLELFDIAGRRVLGEDLGGFGPGPHVASVSGGSGLAPGVYRVRVRAGAAAAERMLVRSR